MPTKLCTLLAVLLLGVIALTACQAPPRIGTEVTSDQGPYRVVTASELQSMLVAKDFVMVNVHTPWQGDIPQTDLRMPFDQIAQNLSQLPGDKNAKIMVYCLTSGMAKQAIGSSKVIPI